MKVFLSYAQADRDAARFLAEGLARFGHKVWDPADALFPGDNWALRIGKALQESEAMVVLLSPQAMRSDQVRQDIEYALRSAQYKGRLIPVLVKPTKDIPWILKRFPIVRFRRDRDEASRQVAEYVEHGFELVPAKS